MTSLRQKLKLAVSDMTDLSGFVNSLPKPPEPVVDSSLNMIDSEIDPVEPTMEIAQQDKELNEFEKAAESVVPETSESAESKADKPTKEELDDKDTKPSGFKTPKGDVKDTAPLDVAKDTAPGMSVYASAEPQVGGYGQRGVFRNDQGRPEQPQHQTRKSVTKGLMASSKEAELGSSFYSASRRQPKSIMSNALKSIKKKSTNPGVRRKLAYANVRQSVKEHTMSEPQKKFAEEDLKKLAEVDAFDKEQAFEMGFAKCAKEMNLSESEFRQFYGAGCEKLAALQNASGA